MQKGASQRLYQADVKIVYSASLYAKIFFPICLQGKIGY